MKVTSAEFVLGAASMRQLPRDPRPEIAFLGRSNVGKSSLINRLCGRKALARISAEPGKTRELNVYMLNASLHFVDLPGYGFARVPQQVRTSWGDLIEEYLKNRKQLAGVVLAVDARHEPTELDIHMAGWLEYYGIRFVVALTKSDKVPRSRLGPAIEEAQRRFGRMSSCAGVLPFSAVTGDGKIELWRSIIPFLAGPPL